MTTVSVPFRFASKPKPVSQQIHDVPSTGKTKWNAAIIELSTNKRAKL